MSPSTFVLLYLPHIQMQHEALGSNITRARRCASYSTSRHRAAAHGRANSPTKDWSDSMASLGEGSPTSQRTVGASFFLLSNFFFKSFFLDLFYELLAQIFVTKLFARNLFVNFILSKFCLIFLLNLLSKFCSIFCF
jgi:hypothetical protein